MTNHDMIRSVFSLSEKPVEIWQEPRGECLVI